MDSKQLVSRETRAGLLVVSISGSTLSATLAGSPILAAIGRIAKPFAGPLGPMAHTIGCAVNGPLCPLYGPEHKAIVAALDAAADEGRAAKLATLPGQREALAAALYNCAPGCFPGSAARNAEVAAMEALEAFDRAHPEVIAALRSAPREQTGEASLEGRQ